MTRAWWWVVFAVDVSLIVWTSLIAGVLFGVNAFVEDVRLAWRRP